MNENAPQNTTCFIDSNIWLYSFIKSQDAQKHAIAQKLIREHDITISSQVINEVCFNLIRKANFSEEKIRPLIISFYKKYSVIEFDQPILKRASELRERHSLSFWDSTIITCALEASAGVLYSEDLQDGLVVEKKLKIVTPFSV